MQRYVSSELFHFVGSALTSQDDQYALLVKILSAGLLSHPPHNECISGNMIVQSAAKLSDNSMYSPEMVCFCDIPVHDLHLHMSKYSPFGLSFKKDFLLEQGASPVFYIPTSARMRIASKHPLFSSETRRSGRPDTEDKPFFEFVPRGPYLDAAVQEYHQVIDDLRRRSEPFKGAEPAVDSDRLSEFQYFMDFCLLAFVKCFDPSLPDSDPANYYLEREWRVLGNISFRLEHVHRIILPESYSKRFRERLPQFYGQLTFSDELEGTAGRTDE